MDLDMQAPSFAAFSSGHCKNSFANLLGQNLAIASKRPLVSPFPRLIVVILGIFILLRLSRIFLRRQRGRFASRSQCEICGGELRRSEVECPRCGMPTSKSDF
jgi:hypothetical protein